MRALPIWAQTVEAARDCSLLIHEATFEDNMVEDARKKRHSTSGEALSIAKQVGCSCTREQQAQACT